MQGCKARTQGEVLKSFSLSRLTKATNAMEKLERKNNGGGQPMTPRSRSNGLGGID
jgi:hypothetical protein